MQSKEQLEYYKRISPQEKWQMISMMNEFAWKTLQQLPPEELEKRLKVMRYQHDESCNRIAQKLKELK